MAVPESSGAVLVQQIGSCFVLRGPDALTAEQIAWISALQVGAGVTLALVMVPPESAAQVAPALGEVLGRMTGDRLVLALSGAGARRRDGQSLAQQIADDWGLTVVAPNGDVVLTPGGTLFVPRQGGIQWWTFVAGERATPLGPRWPVPDWAPADDVISLGALELRPVPAGMLLCLAGSTVSGFDDLAYAVAAWPERPVILSALPGDLRRHIPGAMELLSLLLERPAWIRHPLLLAPVNGSDVLPLGQAVARELGLRVEVLSGFPVAGRTSGDREQVVLADPAGRITWSPFISSVLCRPDETGPVPLIWRPPAPGLHPIDPVRPVFALAPDVHLTLTRAGLWLHEPGETLPPKESGAVGTEAVRLDLGVPGAGLPENAAAVLDELIAGLEKEIRARLVITVQAPLTAQAREGLAEEAARHGVGIEFAGPSEDWGRPALPPVEPLRRSTVAEREQARALIGPHWDQQAPTVRRAFERLPVLGAGDLAAAAVDLVTLSLFLASNDLVGDDLAGDDENGAAYRACVASALSLLPTHRGPMLREVDAAEYRRLGPLMPGAVLAEPGPLRGSSLSGDRPRLAEGALFVIWSQTARILEPVLPDPGPTSIGDLMLVPGTRLVVLESVAGGWDGADLVLLQELPEGEAVPSDAGPRLLRALDAVTARP